MEHLPIIALFTLASCCAPGVPELDKQRLCDCNAELDSIDYDMPSGAYWKQKELECLRLNVNLLDLYGYNGSVCAEGKAKYNTYQCK